MSERYFVSFVEEYWRRQLPNTTMGRIEVRDDDISPYAIEEIRWATDKVEEFAWFRERWDFRDIMPYHLEWLREYVGRKYCIKKK